MFVELLFESTVESKREIRSFLQNSATKLRAAQPSVSDRLDLGSHGRIGHGRLEDQNTYTAIPNSEGRFLRPRLPVGISGNCLDRYRVGNVLAFCAMSINEFDCNYAIYNTPKMFAKVKSIQSLSCQRDVDDGSVLALQFMQSNSSQTKV